MLLAIASDDGRSVSPHVGRCRGFVVVEIALGAVQGRHWRPNPAGDLPSRSEGRRRRDQRGRHCQVLQTLADCQAVVAGAMGEPMFEDLVREGIAPYTVDEADADACVEAFLTGRLRDRPERRHGSGHG